MSELTVFQSKIAITEHRKPCPPGLDLDEWEDAGPRELRAHLLELGPYKEGHLVGWLYYYPYDEEGSPTPSIDKLVVYPAWQRRGIATLLMNRLADDHPGEIIVGSYLPDGRKFFDAWFAGRDDRERFIEDFEPDLELT